jgi:hypothetical protein
MDRVIKYREVIKALLLELAKPAAMSGRNGVDASCVFDEERDHYLLMDLGWRNGERVSDVILYFRIRDGKIWIEENMTDVQVGKALIRAGVERSDIVLGLQPPEMRRYTEYAAG